MIHLEKVIFLDVDGVLNSLPFLCRAGEDDLLSSPVQHFDPVALERLNQLIDRTGAVVVISSAWRIVHGVAAIVSFMEQRGFRHRGRVIGRTTRGSEMPPFPVVAEIVGADKWNPGERGVEIAVWLHGKSVGKFVILDDSNDMAHLADRLVRTSGDTGLLDEHVDRAVEMLMEAG